RSLPVALTLVALLAGETASQTLTTDLLRPERDGFSGQSRPLRRTTATGDTSNSDASAQAERSAVPAPSRIGGIPKYEAPAASGAAFIGYDSLGRKKKK